ncbi:hypothetical protein HDU84_001981, partial [Entophlyctis sp. JEL0112]
MSISDSTFRLDICESTTLCGQGYVKVSRRNNDCGAFMSRKLSPSQEYDDWMKKSLGPDAFLVFISGPQAAAASNWTHEGNCVYHLHYNLVNPGQYNMTILHTHENFEAIQEVDDENQIYINRVIAQDFQFDVCSTDCPAFESDEIEKMELPLCPKNQPVHGAYLRITENHSIQTDNYKLQNDKTDYVWKPIGCKYEHRDSHNRQAFLHVTHRLAGAQTVFVSDPLLKEDPQRIVFPKSGVPDLKGVEHMSSSNVTLMHFGGRDGYLKWFVTDYYTNREALVNETDGVKIEANQIDLILRDYDTLIFNTGSWESLR